MRILVIILSIFGVLALLAVVAFGGLIFIGMKQIEPILEEAPIYSNESIRAIATDWDGQALLDRASPEMMSVLTEQGLNQFISFGRTEFGRMTLFQDNSQCELARYEYTDRGESAFLNCLANAQFQRANGELTLTIVRHDGDWQLVGFKIIAIAGDQAPLRTAGHTLSDSHAFEVSFTNRFLAVSNPEADSIARGVSVGPMLTGEIGRIEEPAFPVLHDGIVLPQLRDRDDSTDKE